MENPRLAFSLVISVFINVLQLRLIVAAYRHQKNLQQENQALASALRASRVVKQAPQPSSVISWWAVFAVVLALLSFTLLNQ